MSSECRGCGKQVFFAKDDFGKTQILDFRAPVYRIIPVEEELSGKHCVREYKSYVSHFSTCSKANDFSSSKKRMDGNAEETKA
jgi:hypothetical protein